KGRRVDRVDPVEGRDGGADLVALQAADQVPDGVAVGRRALRACFLDVVLPDVLDAGVQGGLDGGRRERLRDGNDTDGRRVPSDPAGGLEHRRPHRGGAADDV